MSHNYLLDLDQYIDTRISSLHTASKKTVLSLQERYRSKGRLDALEGFHSLLFREYYPKLPQRLYRRLSIKSCQAPASEPDDRENT